jgi:hypothetical protein
MRSFARACAAAVAAAAMLVLGEMPAAVMAAEGGLTFETLNTRLVEAEYAVRGPVVDLAKQLGKELADPAGNTLPFDELIFCNIGNPQSLGQKPLDFNREVLALVQMPSHLLDSDAAKSMFSQTARDRAAKYLAAVKAVGAYSDSQGYPIVRGEVADFITQRDGAELGAADPDSIFLTDGASAGVKMMCVRFSLLHAGADAVVGPGATAMLDCTMIEWVWWPLPPLEVGNALCVHATPHLPHSLRPRCPAVPSSPCAMHTIRTQAKPRHARTHARPRATTVAKKGTSLPSATATRTASWCPSRSTRSTPRWPR